MCRGDGASGKVSNLQPEAYKATALPIELRRQSLSRWLSFARWVARAFLFFTLLAAPVQAQNADPAPHERFHQFYREWKQPGGISCCNANEYMEYEGKRTHIFGDCEPTTAHLVNGHWFARVPQYLIDKGADEFVEVPDERVNHEINPSPNEAHLCAIEHWRDGKLIILVLCFVPQFGGG